MKNVLEGSSIEMNKSFMSLIKGVAISIISTLVAIFIFSIIITYTNFSEHWIVPVMIGIVAISIFAGTTISTLKLTKNGLLNGGLVGFFYVFILYLTSSSLGTGFTLNTNAIIMIVLSVIVGMIGGIVGVNSGNKR